MSWLWPWRGGGSSTASFEKTLSTLSQRITDAQAESNSIRSRSRRFKVLVTLYLSFAYLVYAIVIALVVGYSNMGVYEWTGVAGGPILTYAIRAVLGVYYNFRIDTLTSRLKALQSERAKTIQKLKEATKYDSTLELLEKYGGSEASRSLHQDTNSHQDKEEGKDSRGLRDTAVTSDRTKLPPPPTANIQRDVSSLNKTQPVPDHAAPATKTPMLVSTSEEFAPNAFGLAPPVPQPANNFDPTLSSSNWYDRLLDLLLGEDETAPKNRIALICKQCRLVNGQAPPGTKSQADVGMWKCMACTTQNGEVDEGTKIMREALEARRRELKKAADGPIPARSDGGSHSEGLRDDPNDLDEVERIDQGQGETEEQGGERPVKNAWKQRKGKRKG